MERLTYRTQLGVSMDKSEDCHTCSICWNCDIPPRKCKYISDALKKLADYEDLEEQGRLLKLPISEDRPVYSIEYCCGVNSSNKSGLCFKGYCKNCADKDYFIKIGIARHCTISEINKSVFFTKEKAEAKLKELRGKENDRETEICN